MNEISIAISGGVSLCTYELGVLLSFYQAFLEKESFSVETVSGTSAGAISGFIFSLAMHKALNPFAFEEIIVKYTGVENLISSDDSSVFDFRKLESLYKELLESDDKCAHEYSNDECIKNRCFKYCKLKSCGKVKTKNVLLILGITNIDGLVYEVKDRTFVRNYEMRQHRTCYNIDFNKLDSYSKKELFDSLCASASFPLFFPVVNSNVNTASITGLSEHYESSEFSLNLTDGGLTDNLPLKPIVESVKNSDRIIMIIPHPENVKNLITEANKNHGFLPMDNPFKILMRIFNVAMYQSLYWDVNTFIRINGEVAENKRLLQKMTDVYDAMNIDERRIIEKYMNLISDSGASMFEKFKNSKIALRLDMISPDTPEQDLSGEIMSHFGGFFDERMRKSDFHLGYSNGLKYLRNNSIDLNRIMEKGMNCGNMKYKDMRNKNFIWILILKIIIVFLHPHRKRVYAVLPYLFAKFTLSILLSFKS
ncbi:TPA: hypothetical protein DCW38_01265 [candidate division WOR-3 bacterium]|jgi:predicted acylesterase/phospholipase RssA|uniref:PNPLA domain-containing protein n=1 Tax=candidate division WOR-3 bacterium TaxID=2052148 RepID=A0A350H8D0_UNCW3|nr:hypothetical protein [candidate division WOR-3 bacterium]